MEIQQPHILSKSNEHYSNLQHWHRHLEENQDIAVKARCQAHSWLPKASLGQSANASTPMLQLQKTPIHAWTKLMLIRHFQWEQSLRWRKGNNPPFSNISTRSITKSSLKESQPYKNCINSQCIHSYNIESKIIQIKVGRNQNSPHQRELPLLVHHFRTYPWVA